MIALRPAVAADAGAIAAIYTPHVLAGEASFETAAPDAAEMARRMAVSDGLYPWLVAMRAEPMAGYAYASRCHAREAYRWAVETTVYVAEGARGAGVGRRLYGALIATLCAQGFTQALARIALPNPSSVALHETLGFRALGVEEAIGWKNGRWIDVGVWRRALAAPTAPPAEPRRFAEVGLIEG